MIIALRRSGQFFKSKHFSWGKLEIKWQVKKSKPIMNCTFDLSFHAKSFGDTVPQARNRREQPGWPATPGQQVLHLGLLSQEYTPYAPMPSQHHQRAALLSTGARWEWTEFRAFQTSSARLKDHKSQKWKTGMRNKTLGFPRTASHFLWAVNNHS